MRADVVFVMEKNRKNRIAEKFGEALDGKRVVCLFIEDIYEPMDEALVAELRRTLAPHLELPATGATSSERRPQSP